MYNSNNMQIFEYYFNPKNEEGKNFKTFIYQPKMTSEKRLGSLYIIGETKLDGSNLLQRLARKIKDSFYKSRFSSPEKALPETLKESNEFLAEEVKKENVSWLGNLSSAIISMKENDLFFTKTGDIKVILIRSKNITNIGEKLDKEDIDPYPLKVFFNLISGKITSSDIIMVVSNDVYLFLKEIGIVEKIANLEECTEKKLKEIFPQKLFLEGDGSKISGLCVLLSLTEKDYPSREFSFQEKIKTSFPRKFPIKKKSLVIFFFLIILLLGYLFFRGEEKEEIIIETEKEEEILFHLEKAREPQLIEKIYSFEKEAIKIIDEDTILSPPRNILGKEEIETKEPFIDGTKIKDSLYLLLEDKIYSFDEEIDIQLGFDYIESYGSNLYLLNKDTCKIERVSPQGISTWLEDGEECLSLAIDSSIWILKNDKIELYHEGNYQRKVDIPEGITKIRTFFNYSNLYLLYPKGNRVIIMNKEGYLEKQIILENLGEIKDIYPLEKEKTIFVLSKDSLYRITY